MMTSRLWSRTAVAAAAAAFLLAAPGHSWAKMFKYTDESGNLHVVDDIDKVPARYRDSVKLRPSTVTSEPVATPPEKDKAADGQDAAPAAGEAAAPADGKDAKGDKKDDKKKGPVDKNGNDEAYWKTRLERCSQQVANLSNRVNQLQSETGSGNDPGYAEVARQLTEARKKLESQQRECSNLKEEGRRAGAPAGWLR